MNTVHCCVLTIILILSLALPSAGEVRVWFAPSAVKVLRDAKPAKGADEWQLAAARNEGEACQLVLLSDKPASGVRVSASELQHSRGKGTLTPSLNKVEYVPKIVGDTPYPDPLPPLTPLDLKPGQAQPVWISVRVPKDAAAGVYSGTVTVDVNGDKCEFPLSIRVWDFALPDTPSCVTAFGISSGWIARAHGVDESSAKMKELYRKYYEMLLDRKVSAYTIPVDIMSEEAERFLEDPRMTSYIIPYPADDEELKRIISRLIERGWFTKGCFYPLDEPVNKDSYDQLAKICERLRRIEPRYRIVTPFYRNPEFDEKLTAFDVMRGNVNVWCANTGYFDNEPTARATFAARKNAGESLWWYVCCGPGEPYSNFFVQMPAISHRMLFWQQKREGVQGLLYWSTTWWNPNDGCDDPWESMMTVASISKDIRGDGSLFYPGKKVGVDGPVSSQRLEVIRDGIEDFDYLTLADERLGLEAAKGYVARLVRSLKDWERDPAKLESVRRELGAALEKATAAKRKDL